MLDINGTVFLQILNFLFLLLVLNLILFRPIRRVLNQRKEEMDSRQKAIDNYQSQANQRADDIEEGMVEARKEGHSKRELSKAKGLEKEQALLQEANVTVEKRLGAAAKERDTNVEEVRRALEDQLSGFANDLAAKILGRSVQ